MAINKHIVTPDDPDGIVSLGQEASKRLKDTKRNKRVTKAQIRRAIKFIENSGWSYQDVSKVMGWTGEQTDNTEKAAPNDRLKKAKQLHEQTVLSEVDDQELINLFTNDEDLVIASADEQQVEDYYLEPWEGEDGWRFRLMHRNGNIIAGSEAYSSKYAMRNTMYNLSEKLNMEIRPEND